MKTLLVINFYGGFPSFMIEASMTRLKSFQKLQLHSTLYDKCFVTSVNRVDAFRNFAFDLNIAASKESIFHRVRTENYHVTVSGCHEVETLLGDDLSQEILFVPNQSSPAFFSDFDQLHKLIHMIDQLGEAQEGEEASKHSDQFFMINLRACEILSRLSADDLELFKQDFVKFFRFERYCEDASLLTNLCWSILVNIDKVILQVFQKMEEQSLFENSKIVLMASHVLSIGEDNTFAPPCPNERSTRSFVIVKDRLQRNALRYDEPISMHSVPPTLVEEVGSSHVFKHQIQSLPNCCGSHPAISYCLGSSSFVKIVMHYLNCYFSVAISFPEESLIEFESVIEVDFASLPENATLSIHQQNQEENLADDHVWRNGAKCKDLNKIFNSSLIFFSFPSPFLIPTIAATSTVSVSSTELMTQDPITTFALEDGEIYETLSFIPQLQHIREYRGQSGKLIDAKEISGSIFINKNYKVVQSHLRENTEKKCLEMTHTLKKEQRQIKRSSSFERKLSSSSRQGDNKGAIKSLEIRKLKR